MKIAEVLDGFKNGKIKEEVMTLTFYANPTAYPNNHSGPSNPFAAPAIMPWESWQFKVELVDLPTLPDIPVELPQSQLQPMGEVNIYNSMKEQERLKQVMVQKKMERAAQVIIEEVEDVTERLKEELQKIVSVIASSQMHWNAMPEMCEGADLPGGGRFEIRAESIDAIKEKEKLSQSTS